MGNFLNRDISRNWAVYKMTSPDGRIYIGVTCNFKDRVRHYKENKLRQRLVAESLNKYGYASHAFEILDKFHSNISYAYGKEIFWIRSYMSNNNKYPNQNGLNLTDGGEGARGIKLTDEHKEKIGQYNSQYPVRYWLGKKRPESTRDKISLAKKGKPSPNRGIAQPKEAVEKMRQKIIDKCGKPIMVYNKDGSFFKEYRTIIDASKDLNILDTSINYQLKRGNGSRKFGYIFKYK